MTRLSTIELSKESMKFSAGHFAIFSSEVRENLHGHNYQVCVAFTTVIEDEGLSFDYRHYKQKMRSICNSLNEITLLPGKCKYLKFEVDGAYTNVIFNHEKMIFLNRDIKILPVFNITVEELSHWVLNEILLDRTELEQNKIQEIKVKVYSGPGQSGSAEWRKE